jgi:GxxExxY protein
MLPGCIRCIINITAKKRRRREAHRALGPGLLESAYQQCLAYELRNRKLQVDCEVLLPIVYEQLKIESGYRIDMVIENCVIVENKAVDQILPINEAQLLTYQKLGNFRLGFLLNWNVRIMKDGIKRFVRNLPEPKWREKSETLP